MIDNLWSGRNPLWRLLVPIALIYAALSGINRLLYRLGLRSSYRAPVPVVVIGNLTAGGSGKTPVVIWLTQYLQQLGYHPAVVSRGYGGQSPAYPLQVNDKTCPKHAGDEPVLIYRRTGVPVVVAPKRAEAVKMALKLAPETDIIITDDGLQHYALQRDFEIVVIDGNRRFGNGWWLPAGPLRESGRRLNEVDAVIVNGGETKADELSMQLIPGPIRRIINGEIYSLASSDKVVAIAGIGHPPRFFTTLKNLGLKLTAEVAFTDHYAYQQQDLLNLTDAGELLVMTEKDAVKCSSFAQENWYYLPVSAELSGAKLSTVVGKIVELITTRQNPC